MCGQLSSIFICLVLPFINTPLIMILTLLIIALYSCIWIVLYVSIIYAIITFLVYITGMLVIFTFMLVITPNFVTRFSYWWLILLLTMAIPNGIDIQLQIQPRIRSYSNIQELSYILRNGLFAAPMHSSGV